MPALTLRQIEDLMFAATGSMTGLGAQFIRKEWLPDSAPFVQQVENCAYFNVSQIDSPMDKQTYSRISGTTETRSYTRVMQCKWILYGPDSFDLADSIRNKVFTSTVRDPLSTVGIYPVVGVTAPVRVPEQINNQWWERSDIGVQFNALTDHADTATFFAALRILLYNEQGLQRTINLP